MEADVGPGHRLACA